ncbi:hypothetical protein HPP92_025926 [Vanilla planifolia]|uniref:Uncharacterized protein n=1 Tax=Vanilla planifolia TaxID=51239 RepID=A0A835U9D5_VANPL|nr:hypothetical protein HPP92_025926 [Vanilla planifolia]
MTGKAKPKKHTAKEIAAKVDAATTNRGGGKAGLADRSGQEKGGHAKFECPLCKITAPDMKSMQIHHEARHPKIPFDESKLNDLHASHVAETSKPRPGVRGMQKAVKLFLKATSDPWTGLGGVCNVGCMQIVELGLVEGDLRMACFVVDLHRLHVGCGDLAERTLKFGVSSFFLPRPVR